MKIEGGCYCGKLRYQAEGEPIFSGQCHCRECQYISGGSANMALAMPAQGFKYTQGQSKKFQRSDLENGVVREFCEHCGTSIASRPPTMADMVILKVGTLDDPSWFEPQMAIFTCDKQSYQHIPDGMPSFEKAPG
ncbi:MAG: GFA family protein [Pseudomonadales bacterium]